MSSPEPKAGETQDTIEKTYSGAVVAIVVLPFVVNLNTEGDHSNPEKRNEITLEEVHLLDEVMTPTAMLFCKFSLCVEQVPSKDERSHMRLWL